MGYLIENQAIFIIEHFHQAGLFDLKPTDSQSLLYYAYLHLLECVVDENEFLEFVPEIIKCFVNYGAKIELAVEQLQKNKESLDEDVRDLLDNEIFNSPEGRANPLEAPYLKDLLSTL